MSYSLLRKRRDTKLHERQERHAHMYVVLSEEEIEIKRKCEGSFYSFVKYAFPYVEGTNVFVDGWHIKALCDHAEECYFGNIKYLVINIPPGCMKSTLFSVMFSAWVWIKSANSKMLTISGSKSVAYRDSVKCKDLITSKWYQRLWGDTFHIKKNVNSISRYSNNKGGDKVTKTLLGSITGERCDFIVIDDPNDFRNVSSDTVRNTINNVISGSIFTRQDGGKKSAIMIIMQRFHEMDATGFVTSLGLPSLVHLVLPYEFDPLRHCVTIPLRGTTEPWKDPRKVKNELIWPNKYDRNYLENNLKKALQTEYNIQSQLQQLPIMPSGNIFRKEWFNYWNEPRLPTCDFIITSWDTAVSVGVESCSSACTTWGVFQKLNGSYNIILLSAWVGKLEHPDLRKFIIRLAKNYNAHDQADRNQPGSAVDMVLIEEALHGKAMLSDLVKSGIPIHGFNPRFHGLQGHAHETNKTARARLASILIEQGLVWLPTRNGELLPYADSVLKALLSCPSGTAQDLVDTVSQAFIEMRKREVVYLPQEEPEIEAPDWKNDPRLHEFMAPHMTMNNYSPM